MTESLKLNTNEVLANSGIAFGTSGARGLVEDFTSNVCAAFAIAFVSAIKDEFSFKRVAIGIDNRPSSPAMAQATIVAIETLGLQPVYCGILPTPALANYSMQQDIPCIMVTGSHIPFDRNGLKFYRPDGEITKADESKILKAGADFPANHNTVEEQLRLDVLLDQSATELYIERYTNLFASNALQGFKIGIYEHSSAGRDIYASLFQSLGAEVISLERSDEFVPIDTEAVSEDDCQKALDWSALHEFDAIFSTDGDGDRPLLADENGNWLRGDILCLLTAKLLGVKKLAVPVSCNTAIEISNDFENVCRTKIGSPYVIEAFKESFSNSDSVAGFEANGGFLLGNDLTYNSHVLTALPTRDALLPAIVVMASANMAAANMVGHVDLVDKADFMPIKKGAISLLVNALPQRVTHSDRIQNFATETSKKIIKDLVVDPQKLLELLAIEESVTDVNIVDGLRLTLSSGDVIHLRPSGNAPELRCYSESTQFEQAKYLVQKTLDAIKSIEN